MMLGISFSLTGIASSGSSSKGADCGRGWTCYSQGLALSKSAPSKSPDTTALQTGSPLVPGPGRHQLRRLIGRRSPQRIRFHHDPIATPRLGPARPATCPGSRPAGQPPSAGPGDRRGGAGGSLRRPVEALGTLKANESLSLTAKVTETVSAIHFEDGQRVQQGELLVGDDQRGGARPARGGPGTGRRGRAPVRAGQVPGRPALRLRVPARRAQARPRHGPGPAGGIESRLADRSSRPPSTGCWGCATSAWGPWWSPGI
jgi:hypothetical protein